MVTARSVIRYSFTFTSLHSENQVKNSVYIMGDEADAIVGSFRLTTQKQNSIIHCSEEERYILTSQIQHQDPKGGRASG